MEKEHTRQTQLLNDLIQINNERIASYGNAISWISFKNEPAIQDYLERHRDQSIQFNAALKPLATIDNSAITEGSPFVNNSTSSDKEVQKDLNAIITFCQQIEAETVLVYNQVLQQQQEDLDAQIISIVESQTSLLVEAYKSIQSIREKIESDSNNTAE